MGTTGGIGIALCLAMTGWQAPAPPDYLAAGQDLPSASRLALAAAAQVWPSRCGLLLRRRP